MRSIVEAEAGVGGHTRRFPVASPQPTGLSAGHPPHARAGEGKEDAPRANKRSANKNAANFFAAFRHSKIGARRESD
jgi:hypothetical protein